MFLELIKKRRSVRRYLERPVDREKIEQCLEAARLAPSACNAQPWRFIVIDRPELKDRVGTAAFSGVYSSNAFARKAPVLILALISRQKLLPRIAGRIQDKYYPLIDLGIAVEHLILQATELGLGTCWLGWFNSRAVKKILKIGRTEKPVAFISLGYPEKEREGTSSRKPLSEIREFNPSEK